MKCEMKVYRPLMGLLFIPLSKGKCQKQGDQRNYCYLFELAYVFSFVRHNKNKRVEQTLHKKRASHQIEITDMLNIKMV